MKTTPRQPDIVQACDKWTDREYYKIISGFLFSSQVRIRTERLKEWKEWSIVCETMPDEIRVNGKEYKLVRTN